MNRGKSGFGKSKPLFDEVEIHNRYGPLAMPAWKNKYSYVVGEIKEVLDRIGEENLKKNIMYKRKMKPENLQLLEDKDLQTDEVAPGESFSNLEEY